MKRLKSITDIVDWRLCVGCGTCAYICPQHQIELHDFVSEGIRPIVQEKDQCHSCRLCLDVCPAVQSDFSGTESSPNARDSEIPSYAWGPVVAIWEGHALDPVIRFKGSSGGALTAISAYCLEVLGAGGVLHIGSDPQDPIRNRTRLSKNRADLIAACGSRYSPASVGNGLFLVEQSARPCVIIGKPAEIAGIQNAAHLRPPLKEKILVTLSFFCAETPSTRGTLEMLQRVGSSPSSLSELRYRGHGWPGHFAPTAKGSEEPQSKTPYSESWGFLQSFRPWSVHLWPDSTGELADISCGDPWYKQPDGVNPGSSLIVARTEKGRNIIEGAISAGYLAASRAENWKLIDSQKGLLEKKGSIAGRRAALRSFGLPVTEFKGLNLFRCWLDIPMKEKIRSYFGTLRRIWTRRLRQRACLENSECTPVSPAGEVAFLR